MLHVYVSPHVYLCKHVFLFPDKVQKLLKSLSSSQQRSLSSPSSSSSTSEYTLHTSDFVSTPTNTLETGSTADIDIGRDEDVVTHISSGPEKLCKTESLGALIANSMHSNNRTASPELTEVNSYPLLHAREKKVRFLPVEKLQRLSSTDTTVAPPPPSSLATAEVPTAEVLTVEVPTAEVPSLSNVQQKEGVESSHSEGALSEVLTEIAPENTTVLPAMNSPSKLPLALRNSLPQHNQLLLSVASNRLAPSIPFGNSVTNEEEDLCHTATEESPVTGEVHPSSLSVGNIEEIEEKVDRLSSSNESCGLLDEQESRTEFDYGGSLEDNHLQSKGETVSECSSFPGPVDCFTDKLDDQYQSNRFLSPLSEVPKPGSSHTAGGSSLSFRSVEPKVALEEVEDGYIDSSPSTSSVDKCNNMATNLVPHSLHVPLFLHKSELHSSSVFSSTKYGPIMSAAQSTTLLCGNSGHLSDLATTASGSPGLMEKERYMYIQP